METRQTGKHTSDSTTTTVEDWIMALSDKRVTDLLANIFEKQLNPSVSKGSDREKSETGRRCL